MFENTKNECYNYLMTLYVCEGCEMGVNYKKLWIRLIDEELKDLYGVDDNVIPISKDIRVDSNLEDVSESEFTQFDQPTVETATGESKLSAKEDKNDTNKNEKNKAMIKLPELSKKNKSKALNPANKAMLGSLAGSLGSGIEESPED